MMNMDQMREMATENPKWPGALVYGIPLTVETYSREWHYELAKKAKAAGAEVHPVMGVYYVVWRQGDSEGLEAMGRDDMLEASIKGLVK